MPLVRGDPQFELKAVRGYRYCLRRALELSPRISPSEPADRAAHHVADLILSFIDPLASLDSGKSSSELARLSIEAALALHGLIMPNPCTNEIYVSQDSQSEQVLNDHIDAVAHMMLKILTSPERVQEEVGRRQGWRQRLERLGLERLGLEREARPRWARRERGARRELERALERAPALAPESCLGLIRTLLRVWEMTPVTELDHSASRKIFTSSCQLWDPLEATVDLTTNGIKLANTGKLLAGLKDDNQDKLLTPNEFKMIVEFIKYLQKDTEKSAFIARNADVGINRLCVHLGRREDWDYKLYDFREPRSTFSRLTPPPPPRRTFRRLTRRPTDKSIKTTMVSACSVEFCSVEFCM